MKGCLLLAILFLKVSIQSCQSSYEDQEPQISSVEDRLRLNSHSQDYLKRYNDIDYDAFVGLMGRRSSGNMDDAFMGPMGRRSSEPSDRHSRRKEQYPKQHFFNRRKLRCIVTTTRRPSDS
ncbi:tachykinin-3b isoform X1 [Brienomyrus brachyistius]|uniref:tachykinin-3b isoform X1 n=1 Tax=Brienomyrus brachyistius TaxID=42636 RepID=UPI0020B41FEC|nr:tachykinin-3b isoform X1 [Brienomyrus brachyistius]XP_048856211.1 tachykinin-3b isoform X1 [Brienomyrus brachyistius]